MSRPTNSVVEQDDEIDFRRVWAVLQQNRKLILSWMFAAAIFSAAGSLLMPNIYRAEVLLAATGDSAGKSGLSSALGSMGGLAAMAGLSLGSGGDVDEGLAVLQSREFLWQFVRKKQLLPLLYANDWDENGKRWKDSFWNSEPSQWDVYRLFVSKWSKLDVDKDKKTDLVTVSIEWKDPELAAKMANAIVEELNQYLAKKAIERSERNLKYLNEELARTTVEEMRKTLFDLIANEQKNAMLANTQKEFAFKVLDPAAAPDKKTKPKRSIIVILSTLLVGFAVSIYVLFKESALRSKQVADSRV